MTSITRIDLLRHGEVAGGRRFRGSTDDPMTERGWVQMWAAVEKDGPHWDRIVASPLTRCAAFARAFGERFSIPHVLDTRFREMHFGAWEGCSAGELMVTDAQALVRFWENPAKHTPPGAEPLSCFEARVLDAWRGVIAEYAGEMVLLITHGGVIRVILRHVLHYPIKRMLQFEVGYAAMQRVRVEHTRGRRHAALVTAPRV